MRSWRLRVTHLKLFWQKSCLLFLSPARSTVTLCEVAVRRKRGYKENFVVYTGWNLSYWPAVNSIIPWCPSYHKVEVFCRSVEKGRIEHITLQQNKKYPSAPLSYDLTSIVNLKYQRRIICQWHRWVPKAYFSTGEDLTQHLLSGVPPDTRDVCVNCCNNCYRISKAHKLLLKN